MAYSVRTFAVALTTTALFALVGGSALAADAPPGQVAKLRKAVTVDGMVFNVACGERYTLNDLLRCLEKLLQVHADPEHLPPRAGDVRHSQAAIDQAVRLFGFTPTIGFEDGLARTVEYFRRGR